MTEKTRYTIVRSNASKYPLPDEPLADITWDQLVDAIAKNGILMAKHIQFHNVTVRRQ